MMIRDRDSLQALRSSSSMIITYCNLTNDVLPTVAERLSDRDGLDIIYIIIFI